MNKQVQQLSKSFMYSYDWYGYTVEYYYLRTGRLGCVVVTCNNDRHLRHWGIYILIVQGTEGNASDTQVS